MSGEHRVIEFPSDHPIYSDPAWALAWAMTQDSVIRLSPGRKPRPMLDVLAQLGWELKRTACDPEETSK